MYHMSQTVPMKAYVLLFFALVVINGYTYRAIVAPPVLEVRILEAGKGAVTLIQHPDSGTLLVDTGSDASILRALGLSLPMWQRDIDVVILTSSDTLSTGGLRALEDRYVVRDIARFGVAIPYGAEVRFDENTYIKVSGPQRVVVSYGASVLSISSTTPSGAYHLDGTGLEK